MNAYCKGATSLISQIPAASLFCTNVCNEILFDYPQNKLLVTVPILQILLCTFANDQVPLCVHQYCHLLEEEMWMEQSKAL